MGAQENHVAAGEDAKAVLDAFRRIVRDLRVSSRLAERTAGLTAAQLFVLEKLAEQEHEGGARGSGRGRGRGNGGDEGISLNELAERTLTHQSSVSVVVQRLVTRGLVRRRTSPRDARRIELSLTPAGRNVLRKSPEVTQHRLLKAFGAMPRGDRRRLANLMEELVRRMGLADEPAMMMEDEGAGGEAPPRKKGGRAARAGRG